MLKDWWYYLKLRFVHRTHLINVRAVTPGTWCDRDYRLFHGMFQVLVDFVELELTHKDEAVVDALNWQIVNNLGQGDWSTLKELYEWYTTIRPNRPGPGVAYTGERHTPTGFTPEYKQYLLAAMATDRDYDQEDTAKAQTLVALRGLLWT